MPKIPPYDYSLDANENFVRQQWAELENSGEAKYHRADHNGRPERVWPAEEAWIRHRDGVAARFREYVRSRTHNFQRKTGDMLYLDVLVRDGTGKHRQAEIAKALADFSFRGRRPLKLADIEVFDTREKWCKSTS